MPEKILNKNNDLSLSGGRMRGKPGRNSDRGRQFFPILIGEMSGISRNSPKKRAFMQMILTISTSC
ncbi:hypothetical protein GQF03_02750 [Sneathiella chungangensis]|uniref:Uncharacterized protein n=1 Tax=Sneathiella chungangensis TaxID=1418234 RepID=A0A845MC12_9PROT|nr:hypothetical protein [Sneathiella chungangensis]MZR21242.1 hypothetical protein [Sneathiella chungangensis]